jgi:hypothetical protein
MKFPLLFLLTSSEIEMKLKSKKRKKEIQNCVSKLAYAICAMFIISARQLRGQTLEISQ